MIQTPNAAQWILILAAVVSACFASCRQGPQRAVLAPKPRPVEVQTLIKSTPPTSSLVAAPVASWKTEQIGMEIGGRIEWVAEPNTDIEGRVRDDQGNLIIAGTPIARIDKERSELQVQSALAQVSRAKQTIEAAKIELEKTLPAQIKAAEAEKKRAKTEYDRSLRLVRQKAGAQSDVDRDEAAYQTAISNIEQLQANEKAKQAELASLNAQLLQAKDSLRDAERSLEDCTLYSSFRGQIADVAVVPGSVVTAGKPVATIQMMDPIKVEVEVSAEDSRRLRNRQRLPVIVNRENGTTETHDGFLYLVDPVADPQTRTFTVTLLVLNQRLATKDKSLATTSQTWRLDFPFLPGAEEGRLYVSEDVILYDEQGPYVWQVHNLGAQDSMPADRKLSVSKLRLKLGDSKVPFLGNWVFRETSVLDDSFNPHLNVISGQISVPGGNPEQWDGDTILFQNESQWLLRPGDLVKVDLSDNEVAEGTYVPMDAIAYEFERTFLFLIDEQSTPPLARRVEVQVNRSANQAMSSQVLVEPVESSNRLEGRKFVSRGAHYLRDGEPVRVIESGTDNESR